MDEFDASEDEPDSSSANTLMTKFAVAFGITGLVLGVIGIFVGFSAEKEVKLLESSILSRPDKTPQLEQAAAEMEERLVKLGSEFVKLGRQDRQIQENTQSAFNSVLVDIKDNREGINELTLKLKELVEKLENWQPQSPQIVSSGNETNTDIERGATSDEGRSTDSNPGVYLIQSGDTLSGIAKKNGVSLSSLQRANPTVNPRALQIGQRLVIPGPAD